MVTAGRVFRSVSRHGTQWGKGISENVIWYVVVRCAERMQLDHLAPHDLRRTRAKLCHVNGGELEQIQFLLGHVSVVTTERYLGCKQNLEEASERPFRMPLRIQAGRFALSPANRPVDTQLPVILEFVSHEAVALR
jgi:integrase